MKYEKPEVMLVGKALFAIESSLSKNNKSTDQETGPFPTDASAYQADE